MLPNANGLASKHLKIGSFGQTAKSILFLFNLHFKNIKMVLKHMAQGTNFLNKLNILNHICPFK
jgi:hypothetical protein